MEVGDVHPRTDPKTRQRDRTGVTPKDTLKIVLREGKNPSRYLHTTEGPKTRDRPSSQSNLAKQKIFSRTLRQDSPLKDFGSGFPDPSTPVEVPTGFGSRPSPRVRTRRGKKDTPEPFRRRTVVSFLKERPRPQDTKNVVGPMMFNGLEKRRDLVARPVLETSAVRRFGSGTPQWG